MNIKILDSWLREYLQTKATPATLAEKLSLTSVSVEKIEPFGKKDFVYDIEVTTNRPDLMSVLGIANEAAAILPQFGIPARFIAPSYDKLKPADNLSIEIDFDKKIVNRICYAILSVEQKESPQLVKNRLEAAGIRSLNNLVDITNFVMLEIGHPTHVFDYDRLATKQMIIRESKKGEKIVNLDGKEHTLPGGDIVADDGTGKIIDLLGIMGTANSIVVDGTKRILFFIDNNEPSRIRKTSMSLGIRTDAATLNEKGVDPYSAMDALRRGVELYVNLAKGKLLSPYVDMFPNEPKKKKISVSLEKIDATIGIHIPSKVSVDILKRLGFKSRLQGREIKVEIPSPRLNDIEIEEDLVEEIARVYGYHNIPSLLPPVSIPFIKTLDKNEFYWEKRIKNALKYWGFTETYTYSMVSEDLFEGPLEEAVEIANPLSSEWIYMRKTLVPSLLQIVKENPNRKELKIFELANIYAKKENDLPKETKMLAAVFKKPNLSFFEVKGFVEQLLLDSGIDNTSFTKSESGLGADVLIGKEHVGNIEVLEEDVINFEINFEALLMHATLLKIYKPISKYPPVLEDVTIMISENIATNDIIKTIQKQSNLITQVEFVGQYENSRTFHIVYQDLEKNLTSKEIEPIRNKILEALKEKFGAKLKE